MQTFKTFHFAIRSRERNASELGPWLHFGSSTSCFAVQPRSVSPLKRVKSGQSGSILGPPPFPSTPFTLGEESVFLFFAPGIPSFFQAQHRLNGISTMESQRVFHISPPPQTNTRDTCGQNQAALFFPPPFPPQKKLERTCRGLSSEKLRIPPGPLSWRCFSFWLVVSFGWFQRPVSFGGVFPVTLEPRLVPTKT